jgi:hypothetical protein
MKVVATATHVRWFLFALLIVAETTFPAAALGGVGGAVAGAALGLVVLALLRFRGRRWVLEAFRAAPLATAQAPGLRNCVRELSRRFDLPAPLLYEAETDGIGVAAFGFGTDERVLIVTRGLRTQLKREEQAGLVAAGLAACHAPNVVLDSWLSVFSLFERSIVGDLSAGANWRVLFRRALLHPFFWLPATVLRHRKHPVWDSREVLLAVPDRIALLSAVRRGLQSGPPATAIPKALRHLLLLPLRDDTAWPTPFEDTNGREAHRDRLHQWESRFGLRSAVT